MEKQAAKGQVLNINFCVMSKGQHRWFACDVPLPRKLLNDGQAQSYLVMDTLEHLGHDLHKTSYNYEVQSAR